jgi:hypothetical protein
VGGGSVGVGFHGGHGAGSDSSSPGLLGGVAELLGLGSLVSCGAGWLGAVVPGSDAGGVPGSVDRGGACEGRVGDGSVGAGSRSIFRSGSLPAERSERELSGRAGSTVSAFDHGPAWPFELARTWITWTDMESLNQLTEATTLPVSSTSNPFSRT